MPEDYPEFDGPTIPANRSRSYPDQMLGLDDHFSATDRAWWRGLRAGIILGGLAVIGGFAAGRAFGLDISGSTVTLEPSADPAAFADVVFYNDLSNGPADTRSYTLSQDGITVGIGFVWDASFIGADQITVTPPLGMNCQPVNCTVTVIEGQTGRVTLLPYQGA